MRTLTPYGVMARSIHALHPLSVPHLSSAPRPIGHPLEMGRALGHWLFCWVALSLALCLTGCLCPSAAALRALASDPATVKLNVRSPWGSVDFERNNPNPAPPHEGYNEGGAALGVRANPSRR